MAQVGGTLTFFQKQKLLREKVLQAQPSPATTDTAHSPQDAVMTDASFSDFPALNTQQNLATTKATMSAAAPPYRPSSQVESRVAPPTPVVKKGPHHVSSGPPSVPSGARRVAPGPHSALHFGPPPIMHPLTGEVSTPKRPAGPHTQRAYIARQSEATERPEPAVSSNVPVATKHGHPAQPVDEDQSMTGHASSVQQADDNQSMTGSVSGVEDKSTPVTFESVFAAQHAPPIQHAHATEPLPSTELTLLSEEMAAPQASEANVTKSTNGTTLNDADTKTVVVHQTNSLDNSESDWLSLFMNLQHLPEARPAIRAYVKALEARLNRLDKTDGSTSPNQKRFPFLLKLSTGQQLPANVLGDTTIDEIIKQVINMTLVNEEQCTVSVTTSAK